MERNRCEWATSLEYVCVPELVYRRKYIRDLIVSAQHFLFQLKFLPEGFAR